MKRIVALVPNMVGVAPGQRFRIEAWADFLAKAGWQVDFFPFEDARLHEIFYQPGHAPTKAARMVSCYREQLWRVLRMGDVDVVFVYREAALIGPGFLERLAARSDAAFVYDLDDPTFVPYRSLTSGRFAALKFPGKTRSLMGLADRVITVNRLLGDFAAGLGRVVTVIPNVVDVDRYKPAGPTSEPGASLVWSGSRTTVPNLETIAPALRRLQSERPARLRIVCDTAVSLAGVDAETRRFSAENQAADLQGCGIGLVPLTDHPWNRWKSFFKVTQYMAVGLPVVARRLGSNVEMIRDGHNGFLVETQDEWYERLRLLIDDTALRTRMGAAARSTVIDSYSTEVQMPRMVSVFEEVAADRSARQQLSR